MSSTIDPLVPHQKMNLLLDDKALNQCHEDFATPVKRVTTKSNKQILLIEKYMQSGGEATCM